MTKEQANDVKKLVKNFATSYQSKTGELRVLVAETQDWLNESAEEVENRRKKNICNVLNTLSKNGLRPKFRTDSKTYQGFIHRYYIVFN